MNARYWMNQSELRKVRRQLRANSLPLPPVGGMVEIPAYRERPAQFVAHDKRGFFYVGPPSRGERSTDGGGK